MLIAFLLFHLAHAAESGPEQRAKLITMLGCADLMNAPAPAMANTGLPRITVHPQPSSFSFDVRELQRRIGNAKGEFLIGWSDGEPTDFVYRTRVSFLDDSSAEAKEAELIGGTLNEGGKLAHAMIRLQASGRDPGRHVINGFNDFTVPIGDHDVRAAIEGLRIRNGALADATFYMWHPNGNPPLATEIADVRAAALMTLKSRAPNGQVKLKVLGRSWGNFVMYEVDIPLPRGEGNLAGSLLK